MATATLVLALFLSFSEVTLYKMSQVWAARQHIDGDATTGHDLNATRGRLGHDLNVTREQDPDARTAAFSLVQLHETGRPKETPTLLHSCEKDYQYKSGVHSALQLDVMEESMYFHRTIGMLCDMPDYADQVDTWVNPKFRSNYDKIYGKDGWVDEAYVAYFALPEQDAQKTVDVLTQMTYLLKSVHQSSTRPVVAFNFGNVDTTWGADEFPQAVVLNAKPMNRNARFNFNKFRAMMLSKVRTGIMLDADEFVGPLADRMFPRIQEEISEEYPYPILPVHWMSRDNDPNYPDHPYAVYDFKCRGCPERSQRWAHAHPTFRYHSLPFIGQWLRKTLDHEKLGNEPLQGKEDEDVLNMAAWDSQLTKQWCKFDVPFDSEWWKYLAGNKNINKFEDPKWYPEGVPLVFYTAHHAVNPDNTRHILGELGSRPLPLPSSFVAIGEDAQPRELEKTHPDQVLALMNGENVAAFSMSTGSLLEVKGVSTTHKQKRQLPPPIFFKGKYYNTGKELKAEHPDLRCII